MLNEREIRIKLNDFEPRFYQELILDAWENKGKKKILYVLPRRSGKDYLAFQMAIRQCIRKVCLVLYALPTYGQAQRCIWDAISIDSIPFLDLIPKQLVASTNRSEMSITFINGSKLKLIGADSYDTSLVGTNAQMIILSEAALMQLESVIGYARPILAANGGVLVVFGTPRGKNAFWQLYRSALELPDWYVLRMGVTETKHVSEDILVAERLQMSSELYAQEWESSFDKGIDGQVYGRQLEHARLQERIGFFPEIASEQTHVVMDVGMSKGNAMALLWFQLPNRGEGPIRIIDSWSAEDSNIATVAGLIKEKPYKLGKVFVPFDMGNRELSDGVQRIDKLDSLIYPNRAIALKKYNVEDGIDNVKSMWPRIHINDKQCKGFIRAIEQYHRDYDEIKNIYGAPIHDWSSNYLDCLRYLCTAVKDCVPSQSLEAIYKQRDEALYGKANIFRRNSPYSTY